MMKLMSLLVAASLCAVGATVSGEMVFDREQLVLGTADGMTTVSLGRCVSAWETGAPSVPIAVAQLVVPQGMKVVGVTVDALDTETVGEFDVYPVQPARPLSDPGPFEYVPPDPRFYGAVYPGQVVTAGHQGSMFGYNIASVFVAPASRPGRFPTPGRSNTYLPTRGSTARYTPGRWRPPGTRVRCSGTTSRVCSSHRCSTTGRTGS